MPAPTLSVGSPGGDGTPARAAAEAIPSIQMPKGGGAVRGLGEKFSANPVLGTGSMSVPLPTSPGRSGFGPQLALTYDSGFGNGPFGFGWTLSLPAITRKTDKGLPRYVDGVDSDVFILSGSEDLVPAHRVDVDGSWVAAHDGFHRAPGETWVRDAAGRLVVHEDEIEGHRVRRYRPRVEGLFARVERWSRVGTPDDVHWRAISKDNIVTFYGQDARSRIADPLDPSRIFSWLICETRDDKGNGTRYLYKPEDGAWQPRSNDEPDPFAQAHQRNRGLPADPRRTAQRYLHRVLYGNVRPLLDASGRRPRRSADLPQPPGDTAADWLFEVRFDYGELDRDDPLTVPEKPWAYRADAFSRHRSGFEVRTCRRCERVLMIHHIPDDPVTGAKGYRGVVRSLDLEYDDEADPREAATPVYSFLRQVVQTGWKQDGNGTTRRSLPPLEFEYTKPVDHEKVEHLDPTSGENLPAGLDGTLQRWVDLHGEGAPGILAQQRGGAWLYKRNLSPLPITQPDGTQAVQARFAPQETVALKPNVELGASVEIMDLAGDGTPDVVVLDGPAPGFYEHDDGEGWDRFRPFRWKADRNLSDPNVRFVDLDGDGHADLLVSEDDAFIWHASLGEDGFAPARRVAKMLDEEKGPRVVFADGTQSIHLADMCGDGLAIVRIRNGEVCYWPNLGHGRFGAKVTMDNPPWFEEHGQFDQKRLRLADIDGTGTADIVYLHRDGVRLYFNQSGNSFAKARVLRTFPRDDELASVVVIDLLGNGTACLVWSSSLPAEARRPMRYVELMGEGKPHLLSRTINNLGAETRVTYAPSTRFYLQDRRDGRPWISRLPFPVHVVERVETWDDVSRNRFVTRYAYHHGHFDGEEREFRGFGMVERWDGEQIGAFEGGATADNIAAASHVPPVRTRTWFHTGIHLHGARVSRHFEAEYYRPPGMTLDAAREALLDDTVLPPGLSIEEEREACRALKGSMLREEVYADDADAPDATARQVERARTPYTVTEQNFRIATVQHRGGNRHGVFFVHPGEMLSHHYERNAADPRVQHTLTLEVDGYGNVLKQASVAYGRLASPLSTQWDRDRQLTPLLTYTENRVTNAILLDDDHRAPLPCEAVTFELTGYVPTAANGRFRDVDLVEIDDTELGRLRHKFTGPEVVYEATATGSQRRRRIEWIRTLYRRDDLAALLPLTELHPRALPGESYRLAFTRGLLDRAFQRPRQGQPAEKLLPDIAAVLEGTGGDQGGYVGSVAMKAAQRFPATDPDDQWWIPSGLSFFSADPAHAAATELAEATRHFFALRRHRDAFGQSTTLDHDGHDLLLSRTRDPLGNSVAVEEADYRVLQPSVVSDANGNRTAIAFDAQGMVVGSAVMGKAGAAEGDSLKDFDRDPGLDAIAKFFDDPLTRAAAMLGNATTRIVYDVDRFRDTRRANPGDRSKWEPVCVGMLSRETHLSEPLPPQGLRILMTFGYSDGFGREIQKKARCEPGVLDPNDPQSPTVDPRWIGSGWTIFNNKGKPVREYEPFFSATHRYEHGIANGVSPVLFYDPLQRVVATLHPNHAYSKVRFDAWQQATYDANDTCAPRNLETGDPRNDPDIGGHVAGYFRAMPVAQQQAWQTWLAQRAGGALGPDEAAAAARAAAHADTPATAHLDVLGRTFLTIARNRIVCPGHPRDGVEEALAARVEQDIEGNQRALRDAVVQAGDELGRVVTHSAFDMLGNVLRQSNMEAGSRWMLGDATGKPIRAWDSRGHAFTTAYDVLRRPLHQLVRGTTAESDPRTLGIEVMFEAIDYGEPVPGASPAEEAEAMRLNLRTRVLRHRDPAGEVVNARIDAQGKPVEAYDFKGNLLHSTRRLAKDYKGLPNWHLAPALENEKFEASTRYDALNRPIQSIAPHSSLGRGKLNVLQPAFNEANLLERVDVWLARDIDPQRLIDAAAEPPSPVGVSAIDYDAKGQRILLDHRTDDATVIRTTFAYDRATSRLRHLYTRRGVDPRTAGSSGFDDDCDNPSPPPPLTVAAPASPPAGTPCGLQNLHYAYDASGNVTRIRDDAQQRVYFSNQRIDPANDFTYDALYQLIQATGREHLGQGGEPLPHSSGGTGRIRQPQPNNGDLMARYCEKYLHDAAGNITTMSHHRSCADAPGWTRTFACQAPSTLEDGIATPLAKTTNRLTSTTLDPAGLTAQPEQYLHDAHGNMVRLPHLGGGAAAPNIEWDCLNRMRRVDLGGGGASFHAYDAAGERTRKVWEKKPGLVEERIYLGGFEIFREHGGAIGDDTATLERETLHVMDDRKRVAIVETRTRDVNGSDQAPPRLIRYQLGNLVGSACLELDHRSRIISYEEYSPYGSSTYQGTRSTSETPKRYRYSGKERDEESGLDYFGARHYAAWLGRWTSPDPVGARADSSNLYRYCRGDPIGRCDPDGRDDKPQPWLAGRYPASQPPPPSAPPGSSSSPGSPNLLTQNQQAPPTDPLEAAAKLHGATVSRLENLTQEIQELYQNFRKDALIRPWDIDYLWSAAGSPDPILKRGAEAQSFVEAGVAEEGPDGHWHSTVLDQAIEAGIITNEADQDRFMKIAEAERASGRWKWAAWRGIKMALALIPMGQGAGGALMARAPQSAPAVLDTLNAATSAAKIEGAYINVAESMSLRAMAFQKLVSGIEAGTSFLRNSVKFDYVDVARKVLVDAKGPGYTNFVNKAGEFYKWFAGRASMVDQARRQLAAAKGMAIEWRFADKAAMEATAKLFASEVPPITGIKLVLH